MVCTFDRMENLLQQDVLTGIDYIHVDESQVVLQIHFYVAPSTADLPAPLSPEAILAGLSKEHIYIHPANLDKDSETVAVDHIQWIESGEVLEITTEYPGGFSNYKLYIDDVRVDEHFNDIVFSFKANCESHLDCNPEDADCPDEAEVDANIDYQAKDFWSFRQALLDYASLNYPDWKDRLEADAGVMLIEVMSALGDELSYYQDRVAREAYLETSTQRRSLRHHARLVDYEVHEGLSASTWLDVTVNAGEDGNIIAGVDVWAESDSSAAIYYEVGRGLADILSVETFYVNATINSLEPHVWDEDKTCLGIGTTELYINGLHQANLPFNDVVDDDVPCRWVLLKTTPTDPAIKARAIAVCVIEVTEHEDGLADIAGCDTDITRIVWQQAQALAFEMELESLEVRGNLVPVTAGRTYESVFVTGTDIESLYPALPELEKEKVYRSVERQGANDSITHLYSLPSSDEVPLCWLGDEANTAVPEVYLVEVEWDGAGWIPVVAGEWPWQRSFLGEYSAQADDTLFTLEDGTWRRLVGYQRSGQEIVHYDYAHNNGQTVRFGDNEFGKVPDNKVFKVYYRLGNGHAGNVALNSLSYFDDVSLPMVETVDNPLAVENGLDAELASDVKKLAPEAFRAETYRAVREEDYREAAEKLEWVQRAGAQTRWTGSWLSTFVTPDPLGAVTVTENQTEELATQMDRYRQSGRDVIVAKPEYADIDLKITVCVHAHAYPAQVEVRVLKALLGKKLGTNKTRGFFSADNFTFATPLRRSQLEATIQQVPGVKAVNDITIRRRGYFDWKPLIGPYFPAGEQEVVRLENDLNYPERGALQLTMEGGA